jgi:hypothetical protein
MNGRLEPGAIRSQWTCGVDQGYLIVASRFCDVAFGTRDVRNIGLPEDFPNLPVVDLEWELWGSPHGPLPADLPASKVLVTSSTAAEQYGVLVRGRISTLSTRQVERASVPPLLAGCRFVSGLLLGEIRIAAILLDCNRLAERLCS